MAMLCMGRGYYTVGNNAIYVQFKGVKGLVTENFFQNCSMKACFSYGLGLWSFI